MASTPTPANNSYHVRSISLPSRSHPLSARVEDGLHMLKSSLLQASSPKAELLCVGLQALEEMYECVEELLRLSHTQHAISKHQGEESITAEELEISVSLLDICGSTKDDISSIKEQARNLQSALRTRRAGDSDRQLHAFVHSRKKAHKEGSKCLKALRHLEGKRSPASALSAADEDLSLALRALKDLRAITIVILRIISTTFMFNKPTRRWFPGSRTSEGEQSTSELEEVETSLRCNQGKRSGKDAHFEKVEWAHRRLQSLEAEMGSLETGLESMFRRLIQNRVSILNILSL